MPELAESNGKEGHGRMVFHVAVAVMVVGKMEVARSRDKDGETERNLHIVGSHVFIVALRILIETSRAQQPDKNVRTAT